MNEYLGVVSVCFLATSLLAAAVGTAAIAQSSPVPATVPTSQPREDATIQPQSPPDETSDRSRLSPEDASVFATTNWRENLMTTVPQSVCQENSWHRQCFNLRRSQCLRAITDVTNDCIDFVRGHEESVAADDYFEFLVDQTTLCVITLYERRFARRFKYITECTDREQWPRN